LYKKHNVNSTEALLKIQQQLETKSNDKERDFNRISVLEKEANTLYRECIVIAQQLSKNRKTAVPDLEKQSNALLHRMGMPNASIQVKLNEKPISADGTDEVQFLFDANKSGRMEPISKVASGGELSRLMLSIKSLVAKKLQLPTLIFDEIDFLTDNPKTGQDFDHIRKSYRYSKVKSHLIFYKHKKSEDVIEVIRILHERMDLENRITE
jgi:DNA repair protein RecN (Recombination protein N)